MKILDFEIKHIEDAKRIVIDNYREEKEHVSILPAIEEFPDLTYFANNGLGVVAFDEERLIGF